MKCCLCMNAVADGGKWESWESGGGGGVLCAHTLRTLHVRTNGLSAFKMLTLAEDAADDAGE